MNEGVKTVIRQLGKIKTLTGFLTTIAFITAIAWFPDGLTEYLKGLKKLDADFCKTTLFLISGSALVLFIHKKLKKSNIDSFLVEVAVIVITFVLSLLMVKVEFSQLIASSLLFLSGWLHIKDMDIVNYSVREVNLQEVKAIVMFLSEEKKDIEEFLKYVKKSTSIVEFLDSLKDAKYSWEMPIRCIYHFNSSLEYVYVIGSNTSFYQIPRFRNAVEYLFPHVKVISYPKEVNFSNLEKSFNVLKEAYEELKRKFDLKDKNIVVDVTGGTKLQSIAGALYSTVYDRYFVYVDTNTKKVKVFDVIPTEE